MTWVRGAHQPGAGSDPDFDNKGPEKDTTRGRKRHQKGPENTNRVGYISTTLPALCQAGLPLEEPLWAFGGEPGAGNDAGFDNKGPRKTLQGAGKDTKGGRERAKRAKKDTRGAGKAKGGQK